MRILWRVCVHTNILYNNVLFAKVKSIWVKLTLHAGFSCQMFYPTTYTHFRVYMCPVIFIIYFTVNYYYYYPLTNYTLYILFDRYRLHSFFFITLYSIYATLRVTTYRFISSYYYKTSTPKPKPVRNNCYDTVYGRRIYNLLFRVHNIYVTHIIDYIYLCTPTTGFMRHFVHKFRTAHFLPHTHTQHIDTPSVLFRISDVYFIFKFNFLYNYYRNKEEANMRERAKQIEKALMVLRLQAF